MLNDFFQNYFISPGYNIVNTGIYSLTLVFGVYLIFLLLKRLKVKIDKNLAIAIAPFVIFGSSMRVIVDSKLIESFLFVSPTIYIIISIFTLTCLSMTVFLEKKYKIPYYQILFAAGLMFALLPLLAIQIINFYGSLLVLIFLLPWLAFLIIAKWSPENKLVFFIHMFDAVTTFTSIEFFGYMEQHVVPLFFINQFGSFSFVLVKALAIFLILISIDRYCKDRKFKNYLKLIIGILGATTGIRDFLRMLALV